MLSAMADLNPDMLYSKNTSEIAMCEFSVGETEIVAANGANIQAANAMH